MKIISSLFIYLSYLFKRTIELYRQLLYYNFVVEKSSLLTRKNFQQGTRRKRYSALIFTRPKSITRFLFSFPPSLQLLFQDARIKVNRYPILDKVSLPSFNATLLHDTIEWFNDSLLLEYRSFEIFDFPRRILILVENSESSTPIFSPFRLLANEEKKFRLRFFLPSLNCRYLRQSRRQVGITKIKRRC